MILLHKILLNKEYRLYSLIYLAASIIRLIEHPFYDEYISVICILITSLVLAKITIKAQSKINPWFILLIGSYLIGNYFVFISTIKMNEFYLSVSIIVNCIWKLFLLAFIYKHSKKGYSSTTLIIFLLFVICVGIIFAIITHNSDNFFILGFINTVIVVSCCAMSFTALLKKNTPKIHLLFMLSSLILVGNIMFSLFKFQNIYICGLLSFIIYYFTQFVFTIIIVNTIKT